MMAILLLGMFVMTSCSEDDEDDDPMVEPVESNTIVDVASGNDDFSILVDALVMAGLDDALASENASFTVFAPTNDAFAALLDELGVSALEDIPSETLSAVLLYHVLNVEAPASAVSTGYYSTLSAGPADGYNLSLYVNKEELMLNNRAGIIETDIMADNGVIHVIDKVVLPLSITGHAVANESFSSLVAAVTKAELAEALADESVNYTVFAPVNAAFEELFTALGVSGIAEIDVATLTDVLLAHVVSGNVASADLSNGSVPTLNDSKTLDINIDNGVVIDGEISVVLADVQGTNGIVHVIDTVIVP
jgi:transforming growth factor-beta-induced protein